MLKSILQSLVEMLVGQSGLEPPTSRLSVVCSNQLSYWPTVGGDNRDRTDDPLLAKQVLSQLSYTPIFLLQGPSKWTSKIKQRIWTLTKLSLCPDQRFKERLVLCVLLRKEVIQPHLPIRLPCYDFTPIADPTFGGSLLTVRIPTSGITGSHGVTGGVYKARERIHRGMLIRDY